MVATQFPTVRHVEPGIVTGEVRFGADVRENRKDEFIWKFEDCRNGMKQISIRSKGPTREVALGLVWGAGNRLMVGCCFLPRPCASLVSNFEVFSRKRSMVLLSGSRRPRLNDVGEEKAWSEQRHEFCVRVLCGMPSHTLRPINTKSLYLTLPNLHRIRMVTRTGNG